MFHPSVRIGLLLYALALALLFGPVMLLGAALGILSLRHVDDVDWLFLIAGCGGVAGVAGLVAAAALPSSVVANSPAWQQTLRVCLCFGEVAAALTLGMIAIGSAGASVSLEDVKIFGLLLSALAIGVFVMRRLSKLRAESANKVLQGDARNARA